MDIFDIIIILLIEIAFFLGIIAVIAEKIRSGRSWIGQGYGRK